MDVFPGWENYVARIERAWRAKVVEGDTVVLPGDTSWGMSLEGALADFQFLEALPGRKILLKGNHDYWWSTRSKVHAFFSAHGLNTLEILHNNCVTADGIAVCGSRGWLFETGEAFDDKIINRECIRLELSIAEAEKTGWSRSFFCTTRPSTARASRRRSSMCSKSTASAAATTVTSTPRGAAGRSTGATRASAFGW